MRNIRYLQSDCKRIQLRLSDDWYDAIIIKNNDEEGIRYLYDCQYRHSRNSLNGKSDPTAFDRAVGNILDTFIESSQDNWDYACDKLAEFTNNLTLQ